MDELNELSSYEYNKVIEAMTEQIQSLTVELASVLCDVSRCLPEDEKEDVRSLDPEDFTCSTSTTWAGSSESDRISSPPLKGGLVDPVSFLAVLGYQKRKRILATSGVRSLLIQNLFCTAAAVPFMVGLLQSH